MKTARKAALQHCCSVSDLGLQTNDYLQRPFTVRLILVIQQQLKCRFVGPSPHWSTKWRFFLLLYCWFQWLWVFCLAELSSLACAVECRLRCYRQSRALDPCKFCRDSVSRQLIKLQPPVKVTVESCLAGVRGGELSVRRVWQTLFRYHAPADGKRLNGDGMAD